MTLLDSAIRRGTVPFRMARSGRAMTLMVRTVCQSFGRLV